MDTSGASKLVFLYRGSDAIYKSFLAGFAANIIAGVFLLTLTLSSQVSAELAVLIRLLITAPLLLISLYFFYKGFKLLERYEPQRYAIGLKSVKIGVIGVVLLLASLLTTPLVTSSELLALPLLVLIGASIVAIVASGVMAFIALWRLGGEPRGDLLRKGLVLLVIGLILTPLRIGVPLSSIGAILMMMGAKRVRDYASHMLESSVAAGGDAT